MTTWIKRTIQLQLAIIFCMLIAFDAQQGGLVGTGIKTLINFTFNLGA
jgi:hypothetical protein